MSRTSSAEPYSRSRSNSANSTTSNGSGGAVGEEEYAISHKVLKLVSGQFDLQSIRSLTLCNLNISRIQNLQDCTKVEILDLSYNQISVIEGLDYLSKLRTLNLGNNRISKIEGLDKLKNLQTLNLENNSISSKEDFQKLTSMTKLRSINLKGNPVTQDPQFVTTLKSLLPNLAYINGEHVLLQISLAFDEQTDTFILPETKSWTVNTKGKSLFEFTEDDERDKVVAVQSLKDNMSETKGTITECKKLLARADSLTTTLKQHLQ
jgi:hypothetical protein